MDEMHLSRRRRVDTLDRVSKIGDTYVVDVLYDTRVEATNGHKGS